MSTVVIQKRIRKKGISYAVNYANPITGKKIYYRTFKRYKDAQSEANDLRAVLDSGKIPERKKNRLRPLTFSEVAESLRTEWQLRLKRKELSPNTVEGYLSQLGVLERYFGKKLLCKIKQKDVLAFRDDQVDRNSVVVKGVGSTADVWRDKYRNSRCSGCALRNNGCSWSWGGNHNNFIPAGDMDELCYSCKSTCFTEGTKECPFHDGRDGE